ncbi:UbiA family prenyltransferase [Thalassoroseus pseudoceratinae]|uniref:UbiA family prenyltransferase n=1 Tax=Thalassoroseus pseudoceratinae TaxID=2713176 RepID=UPI0014227E53|nr:UbiA family prenyltransferase [Thalassoroseus pseudoceratinae]
MSIRAYFQLMRFPAVFTALSDIALGFSLTRLGAESAPNVPWWQLAVLALTSGCLYLAGMVFNDVFDREIDAVERPQRPIPSGRVSVAAAVRFGSVLIGIGLAAAAVVGLSSLAVAVALTLCIFLYDAILKKSILGPLAMGGCRFSNVLLGGSAHADWSRLTDFAAMKTDGLPPLLWVAGGLFIYIVGVTLFAREEAGESRRGPLFGGLLVVDLGLLALLAWLAFAPENSGVQSSFLLAFGVIMFTVNRRLADALATPSPAKVQLAVRVMLLSIIMIDAVLLSAWTGNVTLGLVVAGLLVPALTVGRWIYVT